MPEPVGPPRFVRPEIFKRISGKILQVHDLTGAPGIAVFRKEKLTDDGTVGFGMVADDDGRFFRQVFHTGDNRFMINVTDDPNHQSKQKRPLFLMQYFHPFSLFIIPLES